jgi:oxygen-independent coproporphyrinogen-3 oxidase
MLLRTKGAVRFSNPDDLAQYGPDLVPSAVVDIFERGAFEETIFLGLRMNEGLSLAQLREEFPVELIDPAEAAAQELVRDGFLAERSGRWQLTLRGRLLSNDVFTNLLMGVGV